MNIENINKIMKSDLWNKIQKNQYYRDHIIIDSYKKSNKKRISGGFFLLLVFFEAKIYDNVLKRYLIEGARMSEGEALDSPEPYRFYGTMKMLTYS